MADDRIQRPNLPYVPERYDSQNEAAFRREVVTLYAEVDAALFRLAQTLSESVTPHASNHEPGGSDVISLSLEDLDDVTAYSALGAGEVIKWSGSAWIHNTLAEAGIAAASHTHTASEVTDFSTAADARIAAANLEDLGDVDAYATLGAGEVLKWSGTGWVHNTLAEAGISATGHTHLEADITDLQAYLLNITGEPLSDLSDVTITGIASGELLKWNGSAWINNTLAEAGIAAASHTHVEADITDLDHTDTAAIHDNVSGEIAAVTEKASPVGADLLLIEDSAAANAKKRITITNLFGSIDHGALTGLSDDDHPQYAQIAAAETITGLWEFDNAAGIEFGVSSVVWGRMYAANSGPGLVVEALADMTFVIDSNNNSTLDEFLWVTNDVATGAPTTLMSLSDEAVLTVEGTQDISLAPGSVPKIASTGIMQYEVDSYHYWTKTEGTLATLQHDGTTPYFTVGTSSTQDFKISEPSAGEWTIEAQSTNDLVLTSGGEVRVDTPLKVEGSYIYQDEYADVARVRIRRASGTKASPTAVTSGNWIGEYQFFAYDDAGFDLAANIRAIASQTHTATLHGTDLVFMATPDGAATAVEQFRYDATDDLVEIIADNGLVLDNASAILEIQSTADAKIILRDDGTAAWNRIDFYELTDRHGYLGFGTANNFLIVNEESAGVLKLETTGGGQIQIDDGGTNDGRVASIKAITTSTSTPTGDYPYGCLHLIY